MFIGENETVEGLGRRVFSRRIARAARRGRGGRRIARRSRAISWRRRRRIFKGPGLRRWGYSLAARNRMTAKRKRMAQCVRKCRLNGIEGVKTEGMAKDVYLSWLKEEHPNIFNLIKVRAPELVPKGLGAADTEDKKGGWSETIMSIVNAAVPIYQQKKIFETQMARAKSGLEPLKTSELAPPGIPVKVELPPDIQTEIAKGLGAGKNMMIIGGLGVLALGAVMVMGKRGRKGRR